MNMSTAWRLDVFVSGGCGDGDSQGTASGASRESWNMSGTKEKIR